MYRSVKGIFTGSEIRLLESVDGLKPSPVIVTFLDADSPTTVGNEGIARSAGAWRDDPGLEGIEGRLRADRDAWGEGRA